MSGLLDAKSRIMDVTVTCEGRRQLASGKLKVEHVSFTDGSTYYAADLVSGSADASVRVYLENSNLPQDNITFEADDSGRLGSFANGSGLQIKNGQIISYSFDASEEAILSGSNQGMSLLSGEQFASTAGTLLASSIDNFTKLRLIGTRDQIFEDDGFAVGNPNISFTINNDRPLKNVDDHAVHLAGMESLFNDVRLSKLKNFRFLPPVNKIKQEGVDKTSNDVARYRLGNYRPWGKTNPEGLTPAQLEHELLHFEKTGFSKVVTFDPTSRDNRLVGQVFELEHDTLKKLDVIDYGRYVYKGTVKHAFFVGKVLVDDNETNTFVHLFTLVFG